MLKLKHITTFQNFNDFANRIRPQGIQDVIEVSAAIIIKLDNAKESHLNRLYWLSDNGCLKLL